MAPSLDTQTDSVTVDMPLVKKTLMFRQWEYMSSTSVVSPCALSDFQQALLQVAVLPRTYKSKAAPLTVSWRFAPKVRAAASGGVPLLAVLFHSER